MATTNIKLVVQGDGGVGKTCLLIRYTSNDFPKEYVPTVFDNYSAHLEHKGRRLTLSLWDLLAREDSERLWPLAYPETNLFLLCYAVNRPASFKSAERYWVPLFRHHAPHVPILLVCNKMDLCEDPQVVPQAAAKEMVARLGLAGFVAGSALTGDILQVFHTAYDIIFDHQGLPSPPKAKRTCLLL